MLEVRDTRGNLIARGTLDQCLAMLIKAEEARRAWTVYAQALEARLDDNGLPRDDIGKPY